MFRIVALAGGQGLGFRVGGSGLRVCDSGFMASGLGM